MRVTAYNNVLTFSKRFILVLLAILLSFLIPSAPGKYAAAAEDELRGVWVPTVLSLNYPSQRTTDPTRLQKDAIDIIEQAKGLGFNAIFLQVRPSSDAFYKSDIFPWSKYLTGIQGMAPSHGFDPLVFFIEAAHERGLELHAWVNPYRITAEKDDAASLSANHPARQHPEWTVTYSDGRMYWNPGIPEVQELIADGIKEIVYNYNIDGLHIDDYFYPGKDFDDSSAYAAYGSSYASLADFRYANTEKTVKTMYDIVHDSNKNIVFGVSPMGIWANKSTSPLGSDTKGGESYTQLFADSRGWVKRGIVDYIAPQIYWNIGFETADYEVLVDWWADVVYGTNVKLYIGQAAYRADSSQTNPWNVNEIRRQVELNRSTPGVHGYIMYSFSSFTNNPDLYSLIQALNDGTLPLPNFQTPIIQNPDQGSITEPIPSPSDNNMGNIPVFSDLEEHWAEIYITQMAEKGFVNGYPEGVFKPDNPIKRADFVLMLMNMLPHEPGIDPALPFLDMAEDAYYREALRDAKALNIITGIGSNMFSPEDEITRQDMMTISYRALSSMGYLKSNSGVQVLNEFPDRGDVASYARVPIAELVAQGFVNGIYGKLEPVVSTTRAETATLIFRFYQAFLE